MAFISNTGLRFNILVDVADVAGIKATPLIARLAKKQISQRYIRWNVDVGYGTSRWVATSTTAGTRSSDTLLTASLGIGSQRNERVFTLQREEIAEATAIGQGELQNLLAYQTKQAVAKMLQDVSTSLYIGAGSSGIIGLSDLVDTYTGSKSTLAYGGIDPASYPKWTNLVKNNSGVGRNLTKALMDDAVADMRDGTTIGTDNYPTAVYMTNAMAVKYQNLFTQSQFQVLHAQTPYDISVSPNNLFYQGLPVVLDPRVPAGHIFFVNEEEIELYTYMDALDIATPLNPDLSDAAQSLGVNVTPLAITNPDAIDFAVTIKPQLVVKARSAVAALVDIN